MRRIAALSWVGAVAAVAPGAFAQQLPRDGRATKTASPTTGTELGPAPPVEPNGPSAPPTPQRGSLELLPPDPIREAAGLEPSSEQAAPPDKRAEDRIGSLLRREIARARVQAGVGHHRYHGEVSRDASQRWDPTFRQIHRRRSLPQEIYEELSDAASAYHDPPPSVHVQTGAANPSEWADIEYVLSMHARFYSAEIEVVQGPEGDAYRMQVISTSGSRAFDEAAVVALAAAIRNRPFPAELRRPDTIMRNVYLFEAGESNALTDLFAGTRNVLRAGINGGGAPAFGLGAGGRLGPDFSPQLCLPGRPCVRRRVALIESAPVPRRSQ